MYLRLSAVTIPPTVFISPSRPSRSSDSVQSTYFRSARSAPIIGCSLTYSPSISFSNARRCDFGNSVSGMAARWPTTDSRRRVVDRGEQVELALGLVAPTPEHGRR